MERLDSNDHGFIERERPVEASDSLNKNFLKNFLIQLLTRHRWG